MTEQERAELAGASQGAETQAPEAPQGSGAEAPPVAPVEAPPTAEAKPVDLTSLPEFRKWQSERDREQAQMRKQMGALQQRAQELEMERYQLAVAGMDESEKAVYENRLLRQQMDTLRRQQQAAQSQTELQRWIADVLQKGSLTQDEAPKPDDYPSPLAWAAAVQETAVAKARAEAEVVRKKQEKEARRDATTVDTGAAPPVGGEVERLQQEYNTLRNSGDLVAALTLKRRIAALQK